MDAPVSERTLRRYLAGALDPGRREEVEAALSASPRLREQLALLVATTVREEPSDWRLPPAGARGPFALEPAVQPGAMMGEDAPDEDDYVELRFGAPDALGAHRLFVLERGEDGEWEVLFPVAPEEERTLASLPRTTEGQIRLDIVPRRHAGLRLAVALVPADVTVAWALAAPARWDGLRAALAEGRVPVESATLAAAPRGALLS